MSSVQKTKSTFMPEIKSYVRGVKKAIRIDVRSTKLDVRTDVREAKDGARSALLTSLRDQLKDDVARAATNKRLSDAHAIFKSQEYVLMQAHHIEAKAVEFSQKSRSATVMRDPHKDPLAALDGEHLPPVDASGGGKPDDLSAALDADTILQMLESARK